MRKANPAYFDKLIERENFEIGLIHKKKAQL
jgi:hypothetical protein